MLHHPMNLGDIFDGPNDNELMIFITLMNAP